MGQHKTNPVAIAAKEGRLPPKEKNRMSKRQAERLLMLEMERRLIPAPHACCIRHAALCRCVLG